LLLGQFAETDNNIKRKLADLERMARKLHTESMEFSKGNSDKLDFEIRNVDNKFNNLMHNNASPDEIKFSVKDDVNRDVAEMIKQTKFEIMTKVDLKFQVPGVIGPDEEIKSYEKWVKFAKERFDEIPIQLETNKNTIFHKIGKLGEELKQEIINHDKEIVLTNRIEDLSEKITEIQEIKFGELKVYVDKTANGVNIDLNSKFTDKFSNFEDQLKISDYKVSNDILTHDKLIKELQKEIDKLMSNFIFNF
jgi:hypothetical protein